jgi:hypothetical protein
MACTCWRPCCGPPPRSCTWRISGVQPFPRLPQRCCLPPLPVTRARKPSSGPGHAGSRACADWRQLDASDGEPISLFVACLSPAGAFFEVRPTSDSPQRNRADGTALSVGFALFWVRHRFLHQAPTDLFTRWWWGWGEQVLYTMPPLGELSKMLTLAWCVGLVGFQRRVARHVGRTVARGPHVPA